MQSATSAGQHRARSLTLGAALLISSFGSLAGAHGLDWRAYKGTTLQLLLNEHPWTSAITPYLPEFEQKTGIKLAVRTLPESQFRDAVSAGLAQGGKTLDVFMQTPNQEGIANSKRGFVADLTPYLRSAKLTAPDWAWNDFYPVSVQAATLGNQLIGIPLQTETTMLFYRKDLFYRYGVPVPRTLNQLEAAATTINGKEGVVGIALRGKGATATSQFAPYMFGYGSTWLTPQGKANFTDPKFVRAMTRYTDLLKYYGPKNADEMGWPEVTALFAQGKAAMFTDASLFRSVVDNPSTSKVAGKVGFAPFPSGLGGSKSTVTTWTLAMNNASTHKDAAWLFIQWATNRQNELRLLLKDVPVARRSAWQDPDFKKQDLNPDWTKVHLSQLNRATPVWNPPVTDVGGVRKVLGSAILGILKGGNPGALLAEASQRANTLIDAGK